MLETLKVSLFVWAWLCRARPSCLRLLPHWMRAAALRTFWMAGKSRPMRTAMMAMTTSNSISVKALRTSPRRLLMGSPFRKRRSCYDSYGSSCPLHLNRGEAGGRSFAHVHHRSPEIAVLDGGQGQRWNFSCVGKVELYATGGAGRDQAEFPCFSSPHAHASCRIMLEHGTLCGPASLFRSHYPHFVKNGRTLG